MNRSYRPPVSSNVHLIIKTEQRVAPYGGKILYTASDDALTAQM